MIRKKEIQVYAHWAGLKEPSMMGTLVATPVRGKEVFSFEYSSEWLKSGFTHLIDPELQLYPGQYFPSGDKPNFGVFLDSCPDRWGRVLMERREAVLARKENRPEKKLLESDYLLGVFDSHRMGALRFKLQNSDHFLNDEKEMAVPPWSSLRELEHAIQMFEQNEVQDIDYLKWIGLLIAPGSSLGGARPKACVLDTKNNLWIAKFPSIKDKKDVGAWEMVVHKLAKKAGLNVPQSKARQLGNEHHIYLTRRFDRNEKGERIHFTSAMTMLGYADGAGHETGVSYLELVEFLIRNGADVNTDLEELWRRMVFNIGVKNTDDHLRNHGFLLTGTGWKLSPAYDMNPNEHGTGLHLNISETDNSLDFDLALSVAHYFRLNQNKAKSILDQVKSSVSKWKKVASECGISRTEQEMMRRAFE